MDSAIIKETQSSTPSKKNKSSQLLNPNYASVRCTQPLPSVIKLRSNRKDHQMNLSNESELNEISHDHVQSTSNQPLLLTNLSYEDHCINQNNNHNNEITSETKSDKVISNKDNSTDSRNPKPISERQESIRRLGMFQYMKFERDKGSDGDADAVVEVRDEEEQDEVDGASTEEHGELTRREKLKHILHSKPIHIIIIVLVIIDCILVVFELLVDVQAIQFEHGSPVPGILHGFSIAILSVFMVEITLKIYADPVHFIHHKIEVLDAVVVVISFAIDVALVFFEDSEALAALGLLVILRLWRVFRIVNGIILTVKTKADERVHQIKSQNAKLEKKHEDDTETIKTQANEIKILREILEQNGIEINESLFAPRKSSSTESNSSGAQIQLENKEPILSLSV